VIFARLAFDREDAKVWVWHRIRFPLATTTREPLNAYS
jgi:hypothetical protein